MAEAQDKAKMVVKTQDKELNQEDIAIIKRWMGEKWKDAKCSICKVNSWHIGAHMVAAPISPKSGGMIIGEDVYPQIMMICTNCAHTVYFNAVILGVAEGGKEEDKDKLIGGGNG